MIFKDLQIINDHKLLFEELFNGLNSEIYVCDDNHNIIFANQSIKKRLSKDFSNNKCYQYIYNLNTPCSFCKVEESRKTKKAIIEEIYNKTKESWYQTTFLSIQPTNNTFLYMIILENITHYKLTEEKEIELELKFQTISDTALDSIIIIDSNNRIKHWNKSAEKLFGYTKDEIMHKPLHQLLAPTRFHEKAIKGLKHFKKTGEGNAIGQTLELAALKKDGEEITIELAVSSLFSNNEWHAVGIIRDITDKRRTAELLAETIKILSEKNTMLQEKDHELVTQNEELQQTEQKLIQQNIKLEKSKESIKETLSKLEQTNLQLELSNKHKDKFLSTMSHELRTPLNAIIGFSDIIQKQYYGCLNEKQLEYMDYICKSSSHLLSLIDNILKIADIDSDTSTFNPSETCINTVIKNIIETIKLQFQEKNITIEVSLDNNIPQIMADKSKIRQCIFNLITNSIKFTPEGGHIKIESILLEESASVSVIDNGIGIQDKDKEYIFNAFYQTDGLKTLETKGVGIGLPLTKRFVELHNGKIGFQSKYNEGSTFWFTLPLDNKGINNNS